jgi:ribosome-binding protein aMBF1 (putative translation factor)
MTRITRDRRLTPQEAAKYRQVREQVEREKPEIAGRIRTQLAERRRQALARSSGKSLGERIRTIRESLGMSQTSLSARAGISQGYISQIEADEREPTLSIAARLATALGVSVDDLAACVAAG